MFDLNIFAIDGFLTEITLPSRKQLRYPRHKRRLPVLDINDVGIALIFTFSLVRAIALLIGYGSLVAHRGKDKSKSGDWYWRILLNKTDEDFR